MEDGHGRNFCGLLSIAELQHHKCKHLPDQTKSSTFLMDSCSIMWLPLLKNSKAICFHIYVTFFWKYFKNLSHNVTRILIGYHTRLYELLCDLVRPKNQIFFERQLSNTVKGCFFHDKALVKVITVRPRLVLQYCCG